jgi:hypothetical protein
MPRRNNQPPHRPFQQSTTCEEKRRFLNKVEAERAAEIQMLQQHNLELSVYQCKQCHGWHLTRQARTK